MGQHAKRFDAVSAPKGSGLAAVVGALKGVADIAEDWFDPNSLEVVGAMQRFEQGLALLSTAPAHPESGEPGGEKPKTSGKANTGRRRKSVAEKEAAAGDTPEGGGESQAEGESS